MPSAAPPPGPPSLSRVALVLFSPHQAFASLREQPRTALLLVVAALFAAAPAVAFLLRVDMQAFLLEELRQSGRLEEMPPEALSFVKTRVVPAMKLLVPGGAVGKRVLAVVVFGLLGYALLRAHNKELRLSPCVAACALGTAPLWLQDVLATLVLLTREPAGLDVKNPVLSNPAALLGLSSDREPLGAALAGLDLFRLWSAWLLAAGLNAVAGTRSALPFVLVGGAVALGTLAAVVGALVS